MVKKKGSGYGGTKRRVHAIIRRDGPLGEATSDRDWETKK